jgi:hypothetical protein
MGHDATSDELAPLLLVFFTSLLPNILLGVIKVECLIELETLHHPSLFPKLTTFTALQMFVVVNNFHSIATGWFVLHPN